MVDRIEVGDRVRSNVAFDPLVHEGIVQSISLGYTSQGPAPILRIKVDMKDGVALDPTHTFESAAILWGKVQDDSTTKDWDKPVKSDICETCGISHSKGPFTPEMLDLFDRWQQALEADQEVILLELVDRFRDHMTPMDTSVPDSVHRLLEKADAADEKARHSRIAIGRVLVHNLKEMANQSKLERQLLSALLPKTQAPKKEEGSLN